jgi:hypothetical protein
MGMRFRSGICFYLLILSVALSTSAEARLFDAALQLTEWVDAAAAGDMDGDGLLDIVVFREGFPHLGLVGICFGLGDGTFQEPVDYAVGEVQYIAGASVVICDPDGDGAPDLAVMAWFVNQERSDVWVLMNNGDGTLEAGDHYQAAYCAEMMKDVGDLDGDGHQDLALVHPDCGASGQQGWLSVLFGRGDGTFEKAILHEFDFEVLSLAAGDFNGDGAEDLVLDEFQNDAIAVLIGNGDGTFKDGVDFPVGDWPRCVAAGDLNIDGWLDLAVANREDDTVSVLMGLGDGSFQPADHLPVAEEPVHVEIADIDNDSIPDLVATSARGEGGDVSVLRGIGDGTFYEASLVETGDQWFFGATVADFDNDGNPDLFTHNGWGDNLSVIPGNGDGTFAAAPTTNAFPGHYRAGAGDVNGDGTPDIVLPAADLPAVNEELVVLLGRGDGSFSRKVGSDAGSKFDSVAVEDLNRDGHADAVSWSGHGPSATVSLGGHDGAMQEVAVIDVGYFPKCIAIDDLDGDNNVDLVAVSRYGCSLFLGHGDGTFEPAVDLGVGSYHWDCSIGDLNHDGLPDLVFVNLIDNRALVLLGHGDATFSEPAYYAVPAPDSVVIGDLDEDGHPDLAVTCQYATLGILRGNGDGTFQELVELEYPNVENPEALEHVADLDLDGHLDLVLRCFPWVTVLLGQGDGSFRPLVYGLEDNSLGRSVAMDDLDNDGDLDLVAPSNRHKISAMINTTISRTISGDNTVSPLSGTLPFETSHQVYLRNMLHGRDALYTRRASVAIDVEIGNGAWFSNWRAGFTNLSPNEVLFRNWTVGFPAGPTLAGTNSFYFQVMDTTPAPYNQPPYPPSGDTATRVRSVTAALP